MAGVEGLRVGVLGSLLVCWGGSPVGLSRGRVRVLVALLAMSAGRPVGVDRLAAVIWPEERPEQVRSSLQTVVARARREVPGDAIVTTANGYLLDVDPDRVDLLGFRRLIRAAGTADAPGAVLEYLDRALELWRGAPLGDIRSAALERDVVPALVDEWLSAVCWRAKLRLADGRHDEVITELRDLTGQYPLRESLWAQLIQALADVGRRAEAIEQYHLAQGILADELGVDPSPDLQGLYLRLLQSDPPTAAVNGAGAAAAEAAKAQARRWPPRQLPAAAVGFVGRSGQLKLLTETADGVVDSPGTVGISVISGMAGVGKSALAVHWAHRAAEKFPDGQLYANLRGFDSSGVPAPPTQVLCRFLDALGVPAERIPPSVEGQAGLYRTLLAERRILIVLDNARDTAQVLPLLPGSPGCMAVITSRSPLTALAASYGAQLIGLDVLSDGEAGELLAARLGAARIAAGRQTAADLVALCGRLPLALTITAARAAARPALPLNAFTAELRHAPRPLDVFDAGDPAGDLRAVFSWSSAALSRQATEMLLLLSIHPGPDVSLPAAASLSGRPAGDADAALRELLALHLVTEHHRGRFALHDLVRAYADESAQATLTGEQRHRAIGRTLDHYLQTARSGDATLNPAYHPDAVAPSPPSDNCVPEQLTDPQQAMDWFQAEHRVLIALTTLAADTGFDTHAWQLPLAFHRYLDSRGYWNDWADILLTAQAAADRLGDRTAAAHVNSSAGRLSMRRGEHQRALTTCEQALALHCQLGDRHAQALTWGSLGYIHRHLHHHDESVDCYHHAIDLFQEIGDLYQLATTLVNLGDTHAAADHPHRARHAWQQATTILEQLHHPDAARIHDKMRGQLAATPPG